MEGEPKPGQIGDKRHPIRLIDKAALNSGKNKWTGGDFVRGESEDLYFELCFGKTDPLDQAFQQISIEVFTPLLEHCTEIVL